MWSVPVGDGQAQPVAVLAARVVHGHFLALDLDGVTLGPAADGPGGAAGALGEEVAQALAAGDALDHREHRVAVAKAQLEPVRLRRADEPPLEALHGKGDRHAGADRVQPVGVT